jgi:thioredoxin reductase
MDAANRYDVVIIGAGPAGLQAGQHFERMGMRYVILERGSAPGASFDIYPRHRKLISINKVYTGYDDAEINLRWDWNSLLGDDDDPILFKDYSKRYFPAAEDLVRYLADYAQKHKLNIRYDSDAVEISRHDDFSIRTAGGDVLHARALLVATGVSQPWIPDIPGIEHAVNYATVSTAQDDFINKRVLILGKGNSGFETADHLIDVASAIHICSPNPIKMAWSTHFVGHLRAVNNNFLDTYQLKSQNAVMDAQISEIAKEGDKYKVTFAYAHAEGEVEVLYYDSVIACTGFRFDPTIFAPACRPEMCCMGKFPVQKANWESVNIPDLYFAGTIMQYRDYKRFMSGFIHGFRYNVRTLSKLIGERYGVEQYPVNHVESDIDRLLEAIALRINTSSGLWQQPGFLADAYVFDVERDVYAQRHELPMDLIHERWGQDGERYITVTLEFGQRKFENPFNVSRIARDNVQNSGESNFLHPVVRAYADGKLVGEHHVIEDLAAEWREPEHLEPLRAFLERVELVAESMPA